MTQTWPTPVTDKGATLRGLAHDLRDASDSTILRITQVIDTLPNRGATDRLLDGLRPRLSVLRPPRPHALSRVLFTPLDPVIVATGAWRQESPSIPRSMISPVTALIRAHLPNLAAVEASLATEDEPDRQLWKDAASILASVPVPEQWSLAAFQIETGIKPKALQPLLGVIRLLFAHVQLLQRPLPERELTIDAIRPLLLEAARSGPLDRDIVLALLFEQTATPAALLEQVLVLARETGFAHQLEDSLQSVVGTVVDRLERATPQPAVSDEALDAQARRATRLAGFSSLRGEMAVFAGQLAQRRRQMAVECSAQLVSGLREAPAACVPAGPLAPRAEQQAAERLEARLRALRRLDLAARPLGGAESREQLLADAATFYAGSAAPDWLTRADRLRLCEILVGAEAALRLEHDQSSHAPLVG